MSVMGVIHSEDLPVHELSGTDYVDSLPEAAVRARSHSGTTLWNRGLSHLRTGTTTIK